MSKFTVYGLPGVYNETPLSLNDGDGVALAVDDAGRIIISSSVGLTVNTELPAAAALADNTATPTVPAVGAFNMVYDGAAWDMMRGDGADGLLVNLGANNDVTIAGVATAANQTTIIGHVDGIEALLAGTLTVQATDLDIRNLSQTQDAVLIYGSDDGGTTKRVIKTDAGGAIQIDLEVASVTVTGTVAVTQSGTWDEVGINDSGNSITVDGAIGSSSATGAAVPANAFYIAGNAAGNLVGALMLDDNSNGVAASATANKIAAIARNYMWFNNNGSWERIRQIEAGTNTTGLGLQGVGIVGQFDDTSPTSITENQFGNLRMSQNRNFYTTIRDAAGNERGANITAANELVVGVGVTASGLGKAEDSVAASGDTGVLALAVANEAQTSLAADGDYIAPATDIKGNSLTVGNIAHDGVDAGAPVKIGGKALDIGVTPTAVAANDRVNAAFLRNGVQLTLGGDFNVITKNLNISDADGAQTDTALITVSAGTAIVVTMIQVYLDAATTATGGVQARIGFGTANTPALDAAGVVFSHSGIAAGSGSVIGNGGGIIGMGASNEDLRLTCEDPTGGNLDIIITYFTILIG